MTRQGALLSLGASLLALLSIPAPAASSASAQAASAPNPGLYGIPMPQSHDLRAWQAWRAKVLAQQTLQRQHGGRPAGTSVTGNALIETLAGSVPYASLGSALKLGLGDGNGVAEDAAGNLYVATGTLGVVLKVDTASNTTIYAGKPLPTGPAQPSGDGGAATSAVMLDPVGVAVDNAGNLYIADQASATVREVAAATGIIQTIGGVANTPGHTGDGGAATAAELLYPTAVTLDGAGNLYIGDQEFVRQVNLTTGVIHTVAGSGVDPGTCTLNAGSTCPAVSLSLFNFNISAVAANASFLYLAASVVDNADSTVLNNAVIQVNLSTGVAQLVAGGGSAAGASSNPAISPSVAPNGVALDAQGNLYMSGGATIWSLTPANVLTVIAGGSNAYGYSGDGGPATSAGLEFPASIVFTSQNTVVFYDYGHVRSFAVGGNISTIAGDGASNLYGGGPYGNTTDLSLGTQAGVDQPTGIATDQQGNLFFIDSQDHVVRFVDATTGVISTIAGNGNLYSPVQSGSAATMGSIDPVSIVTDNSGNVYVADRLSGNLYQVNLQAKSITNPFSPAAITGGMTFDGQHTIYAPESNVIVAIDVSMPSGAPAVIAGLQNNSGDSGDGGPASQAAIGTPAGVTLDGVGNLYFVDNTNGVVRVINLSTGIITTIAGITGGYGYSGDGGPATAATFANPLAIANDHNGHLFIADSGNNAVRQVNLVNGTISTAAGNGNPGFTGDGSVATSALLNTPKGLAADPSGNIFVGDTINDRVRRLLFVPATLAGQLTSSAANINAGQSLTLTATYSHLSFGIPPSGVVSFLSGAATIGTAPLAVATDGSNNLVAVLTTTTVPAGTTAITAQYSGDNHYAAATLSIPVAVVGTPSFTLADTPTSLTVKQGAAGNVTVSVTPQNGFHQAVSFSCDAATLPKGTTCSFSPASVTPTGAGAVSSTLTIQTTGATLAALRFEDHSPARWWLEGGGSALALLLLGVPRVRRRTLFCGLVACACLFSVAGCGGGGSSTTGGGGSGGTPNPNATPAGTYSVSVIAATGSGTSAVAVSLTVTQ